jgi:hypothetical protein
MAKSKEVLDWYGNPIKNYHGVGIITNDANLFFMGEIAPDGTRYIRAYSRGGVPGDRLPLEDFHCRFTDETGTVVYDSRLEPPTDAKLLPGYIGYEREKQLKRYFPG